MVEIKTPGEIEAIRAAGQVVAQILAAVRAQAAPGTRLADLDEAARCVLAQAKNNYAPTQPSLAYSLPRDGPRIDRIALLFACSDGLHLRRMTHH